MTVKAERRGKYWIVVEAATGEKSEYSGRFFHEATAKAQARAINARSRKENDMLNDITEDRHNHNFGWALEVLKAGKAVERTGWNGKGQYLRILHPGDSTMMTLPYIWWKTVQGDRVPWLASQTDMLADDWQLVGD